MDVDKEMESEASLTQTSYSRSRSHSASTLFIPEDVDASAGRGRVDDRDASEEAISDGASVASEDMDEYGDSSSEKAASDDDQDGADQENVGSPVSPVNDEFKDKYPTKAHEDAEKDRRNKLYGEAYRAFMAASELNRQKYDYFLQRTRTFEQRRTAAQVRLAELEDERERLVEQIASLETEQLNFGLRINVDEDQGGTDLETQRKYEAFFELEEDELDSW